LGECAPPQAEAAKIRVGQWSIGDQRTCSRLITAVGGEICQSATRWQIHSRTTPMNSSEATAARLGQLREEESIGSDDPTVEYWFAAWKFCNSTSRDEAQRSFDANGWTLLDHDWFLAQLKKLAATSYRDSTAALVAKLLLR